MILIAIYGCGFPEIARMFCRLEIKIKINCQRRITSIERDGLISVINTCFELDVQGQVWTAAGSRICLKQARAEGTLRFGWVKSNQRIGWTARDKLFGISWSACS